RIFRARRLTARPGRETRKSLPPIAVGTAVEQNRPGTFAQGGRRVYRKAIARLAGRSLIPLIGPLHSPAAAGPRLRPNRVENPRTLRRTLCALPGGRRWLRSGGTQLRRQWLPKTSSGMTEHDSCAIGRRDVRVPDQAPARRTIPIEITGEIRSRNSGSAAAGDGPEPQVGVSGGA